MATGLDFPGNSYGQTCRFQFANPHLNGLPIYGPSGQGVTYIWKCKPASQDTYSTTFFWGEGDGTFDSSCYYGAGPYPDWVGGQIWELAVDGNDYGTEPVVNDQWKTQALRVWDDGAGYKHHIFYWDLPNIDSAHYVSQNVPDPYGDTNPSVPVLVWGDAPWNPANEIYHGVIRAIAIYNNLLSESDMVAEAATPLSTTAGQNNIWYLNTNPTPTDISDKSGAGHNPAWIGAGRPELWTDTAGIFGFASTPADDGSNTTNPTAITPPSSMTAGMLCVLVAMERATNGGGSLSINNNGGQTWTDLGSVGATSIGVHAWWCEFDGTWDANPAVNFVGTTHNSAYLIVFNSNDITKNWAVDVALIERDFASPSSPYDVSFAGITTGVANAIVLAGWFTADDNTWVLQTGGWANPGSIAQIRNNASQDGSASFAWLFKATAGGTGAVVNREVDVAPDAGTGFLVSFKEVTPTNTWAYTGSGGVTFAGTAIPSKDKIFLTSGGIAISGIAPVSRVKNFLPSNGFVISGTGEVAGVKTFLPSGGFINSGIAEVVTAKDFLARGGLDFAGSATIVRDKSFLATGGFAVNGSAITTYIPYANSWEYVGTGGFQTSGSAVTEPLKIYSCVPSGGFINSGSAIVAKIRNFLATGGFSNGGRAELEVIKTFLASGGVTISGIATTAYQPGGAVWEYAGAGGAVSGGSAFLAKIKTLLASGGSTIAGTANIVKEKVFRTTGGTISAGTAFLAKVKTFLGFGGTTSGGVASTYFTPGESATIYIYRASGGFICAGRAIIDFTGRDTDPLREMPTRRYARGVVAIYPAIPAIG